jgi:hypothetical protein
VFKRKEICQSTENLNSGSSLAILGGIAALKTNHLLSFCAVGFIVLSCFISSFQNSISTGPDSQGITNQSVATYRNFTFTWEPETQSIVCGTFTIEVSIRLENITCPFYFTSNMFYMTIKVHDDDYACDDRLGLTLDTNHNGFIDFTTDCSQLFYADNSTIRVAALLPDGRMGPAEIPREKTFTCTYDADEGYTFGPYVKLVGDIERRVGDGPLYTPICICFFDHNQCSGNNMVFIEFVVYLK